MSTNVRDMRRIPADQQAIMDKCYHPTGTFIEFQKEWIEQSIPQRFEEAVRRYPDRVAVKADIHEVTYVELNRSANRIAHAILETRGDAEEPVALLFDHGVNGIAAIMGALKAGKTCVSLYPLSDRARIEHIMKDCGAALVVADVKNLALANEIGNDSVRAINVDDLIGHYSANDPGLSIAPNRLACIMYTSGSTGSAKGVVQNHRNLLHVVMAHTNSFHICREDRITLLYTFGSIGAVREILSTLLSGASLFPFDLKREGLAGLPQWLIREEITCYRSVASVFRNMMNNPKGEEFPNLRLVYLGSEPIHTRDFELYREHFPPSCIFAAGLGATEISPVCLYFADHRSEFSGGSVPGGYAVDGVEVLLLDDEGKEADHSQVGEIAIKSRYLALGYHRRPDLTQAVFLPGQSGGEERIYRTGDVGVIRPDGCVVHMGRKDSQIKIRGYLVDVGQVEGALLKLENIKEAAVVAHEDAVGNQRLVAYIVLKSNVVSGVRPIRDALSEDLPVHMVPTAFEFLDSLPRTDTHKINRKALAAPGNERPDMDIPFAAPRTPIEVELANIWSGALGLDRVGINDSFFDLGGHSLLASRILSRAINTFQAELPLKALFESPTVAEMALLITEHQANKANEIDIDRMLAELESLSDQHARQLLADDVPLSHGEGRGT